MTATTEKPPLKVYWQPGCSSCLKTKEFLIANGVEFESINVLEDENAFSELEGLGVRMAPIVARGQNWANGAVFRDVARIAGFDWRAREMLPPEAMVARINGIVDAARRFARQIPEVFLNRVEHGAPYTYEALLSNVPAELETKDDLLRYAEGVKSRLNAWWKSAGEHTDFTQPGKVSYGDVTLHGVLERTARHSGQHARQLMLTLEKLGVAPDGPLTDADFAGLPMPKNVWNNEKTWD